MPDSCPDRTCPIATEANRRDDDEPRPEDDLLCWRAYHGDTCQRPVDWRARALAAERETAVISANHAEAHRLTLGALQAHRDAQSMLEEVAADNDRLSTLLHNYEANHGARCDAEQERYATIAEGACRFLHEHLESLLQHPRPPAQIADRIRALSSFLSAPGHEVPGLRAQRDARDAALDAFALRIRDLLAELAAVRAQRDAVEAKLEQACSEVAIRNEQLEQARAEIERLQREASL